MWPGISSGQDQGVFACRGVWGPGKGQGGQVEMGRGTHSTHVAPMVQEASTCSCGEAHSARMAWACRTTEIHSHSAPSFGDRGVHQVFAPFPAVACVDS